MAGSEWREGRQSRQSSLEMLEGSRRKSYIRRVDTDVSGKADAVEASMCVAVKVIAAAM